MKELSFQDFVKEILKRAEYKKGKDSDCVIAIASDLPGCMTQGDNFEEARENLIDAIELWITSALRDGDKIPSVSGKVLITSRRSQKFVQRKFAYA
jgi:predicted RNase H-like HicB family nuclease